MLLLLLCVVALAAIFLVAGCTDSGSQVGHGTPSLEDISEGVLVKLELDGLPEPKEFYLARPTPVRADNDLISTLRLIARHKILEQ